MEYRYLKFVIFSIAVFFISHSIQAQYTSTKVKTKHEQYTDSLKQVKYDHVFPIWGQKAYAKGFDIPYPIGGMVNCMCMKQGVTMDNLQLGLSSANQDIPLTDVDLIQFGENTNTAYSFNVRPDLWVFPFLNVYAILGYGTSETEVKIVAPLDLQSNVSQSITTFGIGAMVAGGVGPVWISGDFNVTWNKPELLDQPVRVVVAGIRTGHTFVFNDKPERNFALWVGAMYANMDSKTEGQITLSEALPSDVWDRRDAFVQDYYDWYDGATIPEKAIADRVLTPIVERIDAADGSAIIKYGMDKQVKQNWNGLIGAQYQFNKHWMLRTEAGVLGDRKSVMASVNYRFLL
jgi:opacity protein-like surface antigen